MTESQEYLLKRGVLLIISAPSGAGKTSLVQALAAADDQSVISVSYTTRAKRKDEEDGIAYHFIDTDTFRDMASHGEFLEYATVFDNQYGTSRAWVEEQQQAGKNVILEIDWQGEEQVKKFFPRCVTIFILPPSFATLEQRLRDRGNDEEAVIERRMQDALNEISHYRGYDYVVVNDDFDEALGHLQAIVHSSRHSLRYQSRFYDRFVAKLTDQAKDIQK
ncbi:MAG: guanylate kinase [Thiotrichales bacterium]|nr:guanylate kinase [Thiotrichales bacterium]